MQVQNTLSLLLVLCVPVVLGFNNARGPFPSSRAAMDVSTAIPTAFPKAVDPQSYTSIKLTAVPGFFINEPRGSESLDPASVSRLDMHFDQDNFVAINVSLAASWPSEVKTNSSRGQVDVAGKLAWNALKTRVGAMNAESVMVGSSTRYKVLFLSRHGQGYHNAAEAHFGTNAWECYWAMQGTNGTHEWGPDAKLTPHGIDEAAQTAAAWRKQISLGAPIPERHFVSPLSRSIKTMEVTWKDVYGWLGGSTLNSAPRELKPVVKEILRETLSLHYYDHRSHLTTLHQNFPYLLFSPLPTQYSGAAAFPEEDPFWDFHRESYFMRDLRVKTALQELIAEAGDNVTYIGVTCHYGVIQSALKVLGHHPVEVGTAGVVPVVVRVEDGVVNGTSGGWYEKHAKRVEEEIVRRSVCDGFSEVWVQGGYVVPGGMGPDE